MGAVIPDRRSRGDWSGDQPVNGSCDFTGYYSWFRLATPWQ
jgi:hypothetical protein